MCSVGVEKTLATPAITMYCSSCAFDSPLSEMLYRYSAAIPSGDSGGGAATVVVCCGNRCHRQCHADRVPAQRLPVLSGSAKTLPTP